MKKKTIVISGVVIILVFLFGIMLLLFLKYQMLYLRMDYWSIGAYLEHPHNTIVSLHFLNICSGKCAKMLQCAKNPSLNPTFILFNYLFLSFLLLKNQMLYLRVDYWSIGAFLEHPHNTICNNIVIIFVITL